MRRFLTLLCVVIWATAQLPAQLFKYLDTQGGLSSHGVLSIEKDSKGYMWFLTHEGVDKYNGKQYVHYKLMDNGKAVQQFPGINTLQADSQKDIWALGKDGRIFHYNPMNDQFDLVFHLTDSLQTNLRLPLTATKIDSNDQLWMCTKSSQYIYDTRTHQFKTLDSPIQEEITYITQSDSNQYYIGTTHRIYHATLNGKKLTVKNDSLLENFHIIQYLYFHVPTQTLLISTLQDGFLLYTPKIGTIEKLGKMNDVNINAVIPYQESREEVLLATNGNGVYKLNMRTKQLSNFLSTDHHYSNKMNGNIIKDIYEDECHRLWMANYPSGITVCSEKYPSYELLRHSQENPNSLINNQITHIMEDSDGDIWFATSNGICCYHFRTGEWTSLLSSYHQDNQEQNHVFISLCEIAPGTILAGGYLSGMYCIYKKEMIPHYFAPRAKGNRHMRPDKYIRSIYKDNDGLIWAGGYYNLKCIDPVAQDVKHYSMDSPVTFITSKNKEELWVGTTNGLYKINKRINEIQQVNLSSDISNINTIYQDSNQITYIGTSGYGMWIYNNQTEELENYNKSNSAFINDNIYCILPGKNKDELIISTENELVCFHVQEKTLLNWTEEQGLFSTKFNTSSGIKTTGGIYIFGSGNGAIILRDSIIIPRTFDSQMVFSNFSIQHTPILPLQENSPLTKPIDETEEIILSYKQNTFSLNVSAINYDCPSRVLYAWKLEGFYNEWTKANDDGLIQYTNLSPGEYTLRVRSILLDDEHTLEERSIRIIITPPFSQTIWAMMIYALITLIIIYAIMRFIWLRKEKNISEEKIQFFISTAHDIRTPLTLIKAPLSDINRTEKLTVQGKANLEMAIRSTDQLSALATKLIDFQKEELYTSDIHVNKFEINSYIKSCLEQFKPYAEKKKIQIAYEGSCDKLEAWIDRNKIDSIVHNLLSNALKYTPEGGKINVRVTHNRSHWFLNISDTGIGISVSDQKKMFKHLFRGNNAVNLEITGSGIGMLQTYKLVKRHLGKICVSSKENEGTTFSLRFPINDKRYKHHDVELKVNTESHPSVPARIYELEKIENTKEITTANKSNLLIVEDNSNLRQFLKQSLSGSYHIQEASNGQEALDMIKENHPDLVLSDIMMPVMRGDDLCRVLKSNIETSHVPVILLTALNDRDSIIHGLGTKADHYIVKPFDIEILKANIENVLANKELIRKRFAQFNFHTEDIKEIPGIDLDQEFLIKATELVKQHLDKEFNVDMLCAKLHMSRSSFYNKIKALTGHSPSEFVRNIRLAEAAVLLKSKKYSIAEVSDILGFGEPKYFTDIFKKHYGMTPSAYMKQEKK